MPDDNATPTHTPTDVEVQYHFEIPELWISEDLRGTSHEATHSGFKLRLSFPRDHGDFGIRERDAWRDHPVVTGWIEDKQGKRLAEAVEMVRVTVECTLPFGADDVGDGRSPSEAVEVRPRSRDGTPCSDDKRATESALGAVEVWPEDAHRTRDDTRSTGASVSNSARYRKVANSLFPAGACRFANRISSIGEQPSHGDDTRHRARPSP